MAPLLALAVLAATGGTLVVESPDYGATVVVDKRPIGIVPVDPWPLPAGLHLVEILRDGRPAWSRLVFVPPGETVRLSVTLPLRSLPPVSARRSGEPPPPRYGLSGSVGAEVAATRGRFDVDLVQRWRLEAHDAPAAGLSAAVEAWVFSDLVDRGGELAWAPRRDGRVHVEEARLGYDGGWGGARAGRLIASGPGGRAFLLDGAAVAVEGERVGVSARGGRRYAPIGPAPASPGLAAAGLTLAPWADAARLALDALWQERLHLDARLRARHGPARLAFDARTIGAALAAAELRATGERGGLSGWIEGGVRTDARGPFETPRWALTLTELVSPAGWSIGAGARGAFGAWQAGGRVERRDGEGPASAIHPDRWAADVELLRALGSGRAGITGTLLIADSGALDPDTPALRRRLGAALLGDQRLGRWRFALRAGVEALRIDARERLLPAGEAAATVALGGGFELDAAALVGAAHPALHPEGGPVVGGQLRVRLR
ncbi:MAG: PEGA domain-containing protein [Myxococcales bacterium]|nr:PEGA domain-containing protein [Myxococcales bacterium]